MHDKDIFDANISKVCGFTTHILSTSESYYSTIKKESDSIVNNLLQFFPIIDSYKHNSVDPVQP
jgi:hypothetical protein